jgi:hypothetical protein
MTPQFGDVRIISQIHEAEQAPAEPAKRHYRITGYVRVWVEETVEAESEEEAYEEVVDNLDFVAADLDTFDLKATDITTNPHASNYAAELARLKAWNAGEPIKVST